MPNIITFKDLISWQKARDLTRSVYEITSKFPSDERFGLVSQMRRASVSANANIAEGFGRKFPKEKLHFYNTAQASLVELESHLYISFDLGFLASGVMKSVTLQISEAQAVLQGLVRATKKHAMLHASSNF